MIRLILYSGKYSSVFQNAEGDGENAIKATLDSSAAFLGNEQPKLCVIGEEATAAKSLTINMSEVKMTELITGRRQMDGPITRTIAKLINDV